MAEREEEEVKEKPGRALLFVFVFLTSLAVFYTIPPLLLKTPIVSGFFSVLGSSNARLHEAILNTLGVGAVSSSNLLFLSSGPVVEYTPYCFGFLTIFAFAVLVFTLRPLRLVERLKWIARASLLLVGVNQARIIFELLLASSKPAWLSTADMLSYPLLPIVGFFIWYRGLKSRGFIHVGGAGYAGG